MYERSEPPARQPERYPTSRPVRLIVTLIAITCLSIGIAVGAIVQEIARARSEDNRLTISSGVSTPDALSATFARVARDVDPCVAHIKVFESEVYAREGAGSGVIVNSAGFILTNAHRSEERRVGKECRSRWSPYH